MLKLTPTNISQIKDRSRREWIGQTAATIHCQYDEYFAALEVSTGALETICESTVKWAAGQGVNGRRDAAQLCVTTISLGHRFWRDTRFHGALERSLADRELRRSDAVEELVDFTSEWLGALWRDDSISAYAGRLAHHVARNAPLTDMVIREVIPGHWALFGEVQNTQIVAWLVSLTRNPEPRGRELAFVAGALVHGVGWFADPQYARLSRTISEVVDPAALAGELHRIYEAIG
ncbi:MAG: hypothetical protein AAGH70_07180 [Pseudomonadota bacterium]